MSFKLDASVLALIGVMATTTVSAQEIPTQQFRGVESFSSSPVYSTRAKPFWEEQIKDASNGKISAELMTIDQLGFKGEEIFRMVKLGLFDFVTNVMSFAAGDDPRNEALDLAGVAPDLDGLQAMAEAYRPVLKELFETKYQLKMMGTWPIGPVVVWCNSPVTSIADLKEKKVRGFNRAMADFLEGAGAVPVSMSFGDMVTGLERGTVDCAITSPRSGLKAGLAEVTTHILPVTLGWAMVFDGFNAKKWDSLDEPTQNLLEQEYAKLEEKTYANVREETEDAYRCLQGQTPCNDPGAMRDPLTVTQLSDADKAEVKRIAEEVVLPRWAERCGEECVDTYNETVGSVVDTDL